MADSSKQPDTTELVKQLLERLALSSKHEDQASTITAIQTNSTENKKAVEKLRAEHDEITTQHASLRDHSDSRFEDVFIQLSTIVALKEKVADLAREKDDLKASISVIQNDMQSLKLQVAAQDALRVYHKDFLHNAVASPKTSSQHGEQFEDQDDAMSTDQDAAIEPEMPQSDPDVSTTLTGFTMLAPHHATEFSMPPRNFFTPKRLTDYGAATPGSASTMMPDTVGFKRYDGPSERKVLFAESSDNHDENVNKRAKRVRRHSVAPLETLALSPITEDNELPEMEQVTGMDKTLWRESWQQSGKLGTLENYARKQKMAMLCSDVIDGKERPRRKRYSASDFDKLPAPQENKRKRAHHQPDTAQPLAAVDLNASQLPATYSMPPPSLSQTRRPSRASKIPDRFGGKDILTGPAFLAATSGSALTVNQARNQAADPPQKSVHADGDDDRPQTLGKAASSLLQQFGGRKTKVSTSTTK